MLLPNALINQHGKDILTINGYNMRLYKTLKLRIK